MQETIKELKKEFIKLNGGLENDIHVFFAPGRVNLIGEHTDYNNGYVMPFSLQYGTLLLARLSSDPLVKFKSTNFPMTAQVCLKHDIKPIGETWINYPLGVLNEFNKLGYSTGGIELLYSGDIPNEAGLSSSASIEMVTARAVNELFSFNIDSIDLVKIAQRAENEFVGMKCGIMDQFAVTMGKKDHAVYLNCETLDYETVPFVLKDYIVMICNTNKKRGLAGSKYNERRAECETAVSELNKGKKINSLSDLSLREFDELKHLIKDPVHLKRALHVISENSRVLKAKEKLKGGDLIGLGKLMTESHLSLKEDYEVSCFELDTLVDASNAVDGVLGSRMTGAGFGGCSISLVRKDQIETFKSSVGKTYVEKTGQKADFYLAEPSDGVKEII